MPSLVASFPTLTLPDGDTTILAGSSLLVGWDKTVDPASAAPRREVEGGTAGLLVAQPGALHQRARGGGKQGLSDVDPGSQVNSSEDCRLGPVRIDTFTKSRDVIIGFEPRFCQRSYKFLCVSTNSKGGGSKLQPNLFLFYKKYFCLQLHTVERIAVAFFHDLCLNLRDFGRIRQYFTQL